MSERRATVVGASFVLEHVPDLVRYGSKPVREPGRSQDVLASLRGYEDAVAYPPNEPALCCASLISRSVRVVPTYMLPSAQRRR